MRADLNPFLGHDERAVHQRKIADSAASIHADGEGAACITGNMIAEDDSARSFAFEVPKNLSGLAIKPFPEDDVGRDGVLPPIAFDAPLAVDVAHDG